MAVTDIQVGGNHYQTTIQPIQFIHANSMNFFEGNVVKYVTRHKTKNGAEDLKKAIHYCQMLLEFDYDIESNIDYFPKIE